jgi:hypothetical protein
LGKQAIKIQGDEEERPISMRTGEVRGARPLARRVRRLSNDETEAYPPLEDT